MSAPSTTLFSFDEVPEQVGCRWFVRYGNETRFDRGFRSKGEASEWLDSFGGRRDWRVGFSLRLRGDKIDIMIVDRQGVLARSR